jgi:hypothetical protein
MTKKRPRSIGHSIGGILVGFDQQIFRNLPPAPQLVEQARPVRGSAGLNDGLHIVFPDDGAAGEPGVARVEGHDRPNEPGAEARRVPDQPTDAVAPAE